MGELQNNKCFDCKFCVWDENCKKEICGVKGCYENSKFIYYDSSHMVTQLSCKPKFKHSYADAWHSPNECV